MTIPWPEGRAVWLCLLLAGASLGAQAGGLLEDLAGAPPAAGTLAPGGDLTSLAGKDEEGPGGGFLPAAQAFRLTWTWVDDDLLVARFDVANGYYLYRDRVRVLDINRTPPAGVQVALPPGDVKDDPYFGPQRVFHQPFEASIRFPPRPPGQPRPAFELLWQGCAEAGLCYPPQRQAFATDAR